MATLDYAKLRCFWCASDGAPIYGSGFDRAGGWVAGWIHKVGNRFARCGAYKEWDNPANR